MLVSFIIPHMWFPCVRFEFLNRKKWNEQIHVPINENSEIHSSYIIYQLVGWISSKI